jgi:hypothetical protein
MKLPIIINEAGKLYIEAIPQLAWGRGKECTFIGSLEAALAVTSTPHTYENLMGWSALAFRTRWFQGTTGRRWCPSSPVGETSEELSLLRQSIGWDLNVALGLDRCDRHPAEFAESIAAEIRAGRPLLAYEPQLNVGVVFGFEDDGRVLLMRDYMTDEPMLRLPIDKLGPFLCFLGRQRSPVGPHDALLVALERAVANWHRSHLATATGRFWFGRAALHKWHEDLQQADRLDAEARKLLFFVNWWNFDSLADARAAAERFLRRNADLFIGRPHRHLLLAAELFAEEVRSLRHILTEKQAFLGPWTGRTSDQWTAAVRTRETETLAHVLSMETEAFGELENLLDATAAPLSALEAAPV